ncbi:MAG: bifunctional DNA-formamidopyrimidine glycosylase/DNA-(apurinic or apyrimidinic site) lyase [Chloroflexi bacterium]|nr:bifunctional DNA-formamidopyrimidine glycosylase/DNA-(apurinic or apyrimidinic site) lyase [Chloroflexota bacterium]
MPELPEVETIKNELEPFVVGRKITGVKLLWPGMVSRPSPDEFVSRLRSRNIAGISRRGKYLILGLSGGDALVMHLRMTGTLLVNPNSSPPSAYTRAVFHLDDGTEVYFQDLRKLGKLWLVEDARAVVGKLGPEPLDDAFTPDVLKQLLNARTAPIKAILVDQSVIAGIGNMYADEALFEARIHPLRPAGSLNQEEMERLHRAIRRILLAAIGDKGASVLNYFRPGGMPGMAHVQFKVAHRRGQPCPACGATIQRIPVRNRGSYFCPRCQQ